MGFWRTLQAIRRQALAEFSPQECHACRKKAWLAAVLRLRLAFRHRLDHLDDISLAKKFNDTLRGWDSLASMARHVWRALRALRTRYASSFRTMEDYVGETPLVRLQRMAPKDSVVLCKLEGDVNLGSEMAGRQQSGGICEGSGGVLDDSPCRGGRRGRKNVVRDLWEAVFGREIP